MAEPPQDKFVTEWQGRIQKNKFGGVHGRAKRARKILTGSHTHLIKTTPTIINTRTQLHTNTNKQTQSFNTEEIKILLGCIWINSSKITSG